jgi:O-methyltransferase
LERLFRQTLATPGDIFECGVYKGGTAALLAALIAELKSPKALYLYDTFEGMPATDAEKDWHNKGDFADTSLEAVRSFVKGGERCVFRNGFIPDTFEGLGDTKISFCHIDVDIYKSIIDSLKFVWPRLSVGGVIVFDDYGFPSCVSARQAVDDFFRDKSAIPLCLHTGQAIVFKTVATTHC